MTAMLRLVSLGLLLVIIACSPTIMKPGEPIHRANIQLDAFVMPDGMRLPLQAWVPNNGSPKAVVVALHGFNDYGHFFDGLGKYLRGKGIASYAYDQRGFGRTKNVGYWAGVDAYVSDVQEVVSVVKSRHPQTPVFLFGESMGGAVLLASSVGDTPVTVDGFILAAPAVWGRTTMPVYQRAALWLAVHIMPSMQLTGRGLDITPSDNIEMLRDLGRDPLVIKETRVDTIWGLVNLMDRALESASDFKAPALILYGEHDEVIAKGPTRTMLRSLQDHGSDVRRIALYENGYHMLIRDRMAETIWRDVESWITSPNQPLPSGADAHAARTDFFADP